MKQLFYTFFIGLSFSLMAVKSRAQGFSILIDSATVQTGQSVCLPVYAAGFEDLISLQFAITWNPEILQYTGVNIVSTPGGSPMIYEFPNNSNKYVFFYWTSATATCTDLPEDEVWFEICFLAIGPVGSSTLVEATNTGFNAPGSGSAEAFTCFGENVYWMDGNSPGLVKIQEVLGADNPSHAIDANLAAFQIFPNPSFSTTEIQFLATSSGKGILAIANPLGQMVWEQPIEVTTGENHFEIPASALNTKGLYQVSLQTEQGIGTQLLLVH